MLFKVPVTDDVPLVPVAVSVWVCVPNALPVNVSAGMVEVALVGTPAGHATVPAGVKAAVPFVPAGVMDATPPDGLALVAVMESPAVMARALPPVAVLVITCVPVVAAVVPPCTSEVTVIVCVWLMTLENGVPVNVSAGTVPAPPVNVGTPAGHDTTCAGPVTVPFVPAGVPALTAEVVALDPVNAWAAAVRVATVGVTVLAPPVAPISPFAATVPSGMAAFSAETSVYPDGQDPETTIAVRPDGTPPAAESSTHATPVHVQRCPLLD
jgi:hypothetical protein